MVRTMCICVLVFLWLLWKWVAYFQVLQNLSDVKMRPHIGTPVVDITFFCVRRHKK